MCSSWRSWISAFTACSLENNWNRPQEPKSQISNVPLSLTHRLVLFKPQDVDSRSLYLFKFLGLYIHLLLKGTVGLLQLQCFLIPTFHLLLDLPLPTFLKNARYKKSETTTAPLPPGWLHKSNTREAFTSLGSRAFALASSSSYLLP